MKLYGIVFSPTGGTQKAAALLTDALGGEVTHVDLTDGKQDFHAVSLTKEDTAVISVPSYAGRVPSVAVERLTMLNGQGCSAILVCVTATVLTKIHWWSWRMPQSRLAFRLSLPLPLWQNIDCTAVCLRQARRAGCGAAF